MTLPLRLAPAVSGWSRSPSGAPRFVLEHRTSWWTIGEHGEPRIDGPAIAPPLPTKEDVAYLVNAWSSWGPDGRGIAALAFAVRGLFASLKPVGTSLVLTGATGSSKTTAGRFALGVLDAVKQDATPTLTFTASTVAMKAKRSWRNDLPSLFDDFHKLANEGGLARMFDALDAIFRAIADGDEWNARGTRTGGLREAVYLRGADIFTGEMIDGLLASAERRMAWIGYPRPAEDFGGRRPRRDPIGSADLRRARRARQARRLSRQARSERDRRNFRRAGESEAMPVASDYRPMHGRSKDNDLAEGTVRGRRFKSEVQQCGIDGMAE
jgi:hypothetical protein